MKGSAGVGVHVGAGKETVDSLRVAIMAIITSVNSESVKIAALEVLRHGTSVTNTTVSGCQFDIGGSR